MQYEDAAVFEAKTRGLTGLTVVSLAGPGGNATAGWKISRTIRTRGFTTHVGDWHCTSACAIAWLGGVKRVMAPNARIGFHAVYNSRTEHESGGGNVELGVYLSELGLSEKARWFVSEKGPELCCYRKVFHSNIAITTTMLTRMSISSRVS